MEFCNPPVSGFRSNCSNRTARDQLHVAVAVCILRQSDSQLDALISYSTTSLVAPFLELLTRFPVALSPNVKVTFFSHRRSIYRNPASEHGRISIPYPFDSPLRTDRNRSLQYRPGFGHPQRVKQSPLSHFRVHPSGLAQLGQTHRPGNSDLGP